MTFYYLTKQGVPINFRVFDKPDTSHRAIIYLIRTEFPLRKQLNISPQSLFTGGDINELEKCSMTHHYLTIVRIRLRQQSFKITIKHDLVGCS